MQWVEFERLSLHRNPLTPAQQARLDLLSRKDEEVGQHLAKWLVVGIFAGWAILLFTALVLGAALA